MTTIVWYKRARARPWCAGRKCYFFRTLSDSPRDVRGYLHLEHPVAVNDDGVSTTCVAARLCEDMRRIILYFVQVMSSDNQFGDNRTIVKNFYSVYFIGFRKLILLTQSLLVPPLFTLPSLETHAATNHSRYDRSLRTAVPNAHY